jgi:hypothetical protein
MGRPSRWLESLRTSIEQRHSREFDSFISELCKPLSPEESLEQRRSELRNGLTDMQRLFLFGKLSGLNDKDAALAAGYAVSVAENTKQRIWKPRVRAEFGRLQCGLQNGKPPDGSTASDREPARGEHIAPGERPTPRFAPPEVAQARRTCLHGKRRGYHCWQCGGLARIQGEPAKEKVKA